MGIVKIDIYIHLKIIDFFHNVMKGRCNFWKSVGGVIMWWAYPVEIGLTDLPKTGRWYVPPPSHICPPCLRQCWLAKGQFASLIILLLLHHATPKKYVGQNIRSYCCLHCHLWLGYVRGQSITMWTKRRVFPDTEGSFLLAIRCTKAIGGTGNTAILGNFHLERPLIPL